MNEDKIRKILTGNDGEKQQIRDFCEKKEPAIRADAHLKETPNYYDLLEVMGDPKNYSRIMALRKRGDCCSGGCYACGSGLNIISQKNNKALTSQIRDNIKLLSNNDKKAQIFGSFVYRSQYYPGDIDIQEVVSVSPSREEGIYKKIAELLVKIVKELKKRPNIFFGEVKAGVDFRFDFPIDGLFMENLEKIRHLITESEYDDFKILYTMAKKGDINAHDQLKEDLRMKKIIRWSETEILEEKKTLSGGLVITLTEAMQLKPENGDNQIKIDIWTPINGRYIEITNFYYLVVFDKQKDTVKILNHHLKNYVSGILDQVKKYSSELFYNPFKMAKRMWGISRELKKTDLLNKLTPLFQGSLARINQIIGEIDTLSMMFSTAENAPEIRKHREAVKIALEQIDEFKLRLSYIYDIPEFENPADNDIYRWINGAKNALEDKNYNSFNHKMETLKTKLKKILYENTVVFLKKEKLYPVPPYIYKLTGPDMPDRDFNLFNLL